MEHVTAWPPSKDCQSLSVTNDCESHKWQLTPNRDSYGLALYLKSPWAIGSGKKHPNSVKPVPVLNQVSAGMMLVINSGKVATILHSVLPGVQLQFQCN
jgi:hypothetical protein